MCKLRKFILDIKNMKQRAKKGYTYLDVCNVNDFIEEKMLAILKDFKKNNVGYPLNMSFEEWSNIIDRMIFLLQEMNDETCSLVDTNATTNKERIERAKYMLKCKDEFYDLLKKYHYDLWF